MLGYIISILTIIPLYFVDHNNVNIVFYTFILFILLFLFKFSKILFLIFIVYINIVNVFLLHIKIHWGFWGALLPRLDVLRVSPTSETIEYLQTYIDYRDFFILLYTLFILFLLYKFLKKTHSLKLIKITGLWVSIILLFSIEVHKKSFWKIEPFKLVDEIEYILKTEELEKNRKAYLDTLANKINVNTIYDKIVIIQGEAVNKHYMSIYGNDHNTTPFFSSLEKENLYVFNAISPTAKTRFSIPILHTKAHVHNYLDLFLHSRSIVGKYRTYGYHTYWISNQGKSGMHNDNIALIAEEANTTFFTDPYGTVIPKDSSLLNYIYQLDKNNKKELYVFHLIGSHAKYNVRYEKNISLHSNPSNIHEEYENTIFYTDYILKNIFNYFLTTYKNKKLLIIYLSDHGEYVSESKHGHGFLPPHKDEFDIPFIIYSNIENNKINVLHQANQEKFNLENFNYIIDYLNGITNDINISYSQDVFPINPKQIYKYNTME